MNRALSDLKSDIIMWFQDNLAIWSTINFLYQCKCVKSKEEREWRCYTNEILKKCWKQDFKNVTTIATILVVKSGKKVMCSALWIKILGKIVNQYSCGWFNCFLQLVIR